MNLVIGDLSGFVRIWGQSVYLSGFLKRLLGFSPLVLASDDFAVVGSSDFAFALLFSRPANSCSMCQFAKRSC